MWDTETHHDNLMLQQNATLDHSFVFLHEALQRKHVFITRVPTYRTVHAKRAGYISVIVVLNCFQMKAHQRTNK